MKRLLCTLAVLLLTVPAFADCLSPDASPEVAAACKKHKTDCPPGTIYTVILGYDFEVKYAKCVPCDSYEYIPLYPACTTVSEARKRCPDRYIAYDCGVGSVLSCASHLQVDKRSKTCTLPPNIMY